MPRTTNHTVRTRKPWERAIVTPMVLAAFLLQLFAVQTHIHFPMLAAGIGQAVSAPSAVLQQTKKTGDANTAHCPWCQAVLSNGNYLSPAAPPAALPAALGLLDPILQQARVAVFAFSHAWQSRAPPV